jgi:hypothetical protein
MAENSFSPKYRRHGPPSNNSACRCMREAYEYYHQIGMVNVDGFMFSESFRETKHNHQKE